MVRINAGETGTRDLRAVVPQGVDTILIPKCESATDVSTAAELVASLRDEMRVRQEIYLVPIIESARGVENLQHRIGLELVCALAIGLEDYCADIGVPRTARKERSPAASSARAAGVTDGQRVPRRGGHGSCGPARLNPGAGLQESAASTRGAGRP
jgi:citrate lyase subunit beta/citryl-CoA lyase